MKTNHSPAPWSKDPNGEIFDRDGVIIAQLYDNPDDGTQEIGLEQSDYNGELIVAAPELLAALVKLLKVADSCDRFAEEMPSFEWARYLEGTTIARAAIAKAEGDAMKTL